MDVREKLVELLEEIPHPQRLYPDLYVDRIIAKGVVHAFFVESGLDSAAGYADSWARNESVVDWFARQGQKIYAAWEEAGALDKKQ